MRELCLAAPQRLTVQDHVPGMCHLPSIKPATDTVVACGVQLYVCPSQVLYAHTARSVLHVSPGPDAAAHGGTSLRRRCSSLATRPSILTTVLWSC
jgi:hypothetical protein